MTEPEELPTPDVTDQEAVSYINAAIVATIESTEKKTEITMGHLLEMSQAVENLAKARSYYYAQEW